jgi:hypothetical protein
MSRISIERRIERLRDTILPPGSYEWRLEHLPDNLKRMHQAWRERCDAITSRHKKQGLNSYELLLAGNDDPPKMPAAVFVALWPDGEHRAQITVDMTVDQATDIYQQMLEQGEAKCLTYRYSKL